MWVFPWPGRHSPAYSFHLSLWYSSWGPVPPVKRHHLLSPPRSSPFPGFSIIPVFCAWSFLSYLIHPLFARDIFSLQRGYKLFEGKDSVFRLLWPHSAHGPQHLMPTCYHPPCLQLSHPIKTAFSQIERIMYLPFASP